MNDKLVVYGIKNPHLALRNRLVKVLSKIKQHKIDTITDDDLNTWTINRLKKLEDKVDLFIHKQSFKKRLQNSKNVIDATEIIDRILESENQKAYWKSIEMLPENTKRILGYLNINRSKKKKNKKRNNYTKKNKKIQPRSVWPIYTPMGNKR
ncbi:MAG TPA: hypothetical protein VHC47_09865 [Mucilaginibacter sp.]|nr:hypothetical protein [Mucilaginibacter sp.]